MTDTRTEHTPEVVEVTQVDRDHAADYAITVAESGLETVSIRWIRQGKSDDAPIVQAFARHRLASLPAASEGEEVVKQSLTTDNLVLALEAIRRAYDDGLRHCHNIATEALDEFTRARQIGGAA